MSIPVQCLLRLPTCLRRQAVLEILPRKQTPLRQYRLGAPITQGHQTRLFNNTMRALRDRNVSKSRPRKGSEPPSSEHPSRPSAPPPPVHAFQATRSYVQQLMANRSEVLIYRAPSHTSFRIMCVVFGGTFIVGSFFSFQLVTNPSDPAGQPVAPMKLWVKAVSMVPAFFLAVMGTAFILAPGQSIKSIKAFAPKLAAGETLAKSQVRLRFEVRRWIPFAKPKYMYYQTSEVLLNRNVAAHNVDYWSVPVEKADEFTANYNGRPVATSKIVNPISVFTRDIRRMFYRDGFAYLRFSDKSNYKVDLSDSELLDHGRALENMTYPDNNSGQGFIAWMRRKFSQ